MQSQLFALVILTALFQVKREWKPVLAPQPQGTVVAVRGWIGGKAQTRRISVVMPAPPAPDDDGDEQQPAQPVMRFNLNTAVVERENFDRWLFADQRSESGTP